jgi:hypothetical protein
MTVQIANTGDADARGLQVTTIELFDADGVSRAELPLIDVVNTDTNETFDGTVAKGETVSLRVVLLGPDRPYDLLNSGSDSSGDAAGRGAGAAGTLEVTLTADNHGKLTVESGELYPVPSIDT